MSDTPLDTYFSDVAIVRYLCNKRLDLTITQRQEQFISGLTGSQPKYAPMIVERLLPPRRQWPRMGQNRRATSESSPLRARAELLAQYVLRVLRDKRQGGVWVRRLRSFILDIQSAALSWSSERRLAPIQTIGIPKARAGSRQKYRLVSLYSLRDAVLASGFAAFLRRRLEPYLDDGCLAYRAARSGMPPPSHHDAVRMISEYADMHDESTLWVAECDLVGFFDNLRHSVVRSALKGVLRPRMPDDRKALSFITSFLKGYSFSKGCDEAAGRLRSIGVVEPNFGRKVRLGDSHTGVAQGSAISCVLANIVLLHADRIVRRGGRSNNALYLRYSDDTIFIARSREQCADMLYAFLGALDVLGLSAHQPAPIPPYGASFWGGKSKKPYKWSQDRRRLSVPWVAFAGYHIRRDRKVRARPSSIRKELSKQLEVTDRIVSRLTRAASKKGGAIVIPKASAIVFRATQHMVAFSVGRARYRTTQPAPDSLCWTRGFRMLKGSTAAIPGLVRLDRGRQRALERLAGRVRGLLKAQIAVEGKFNLNRRDPFMVEFPGRPFSYYRQFL